MPKAKKIIRILLLIIGFILFSVISFIYLNRNTYVFHLVEFWRRDASIYYKLSNEEANPWKCSEENMQFVAEEYVRTEPLYEEIEIANGTLTTEDGEEIEFHIETEGESHFLTVYIEEHEYRCMGLYSYVSDDERTYTLIFNHKNWPKEYLGEDIRPITFVKKY